MRKIAVFVFLALACSAYAGPADPALRVKRGKFKRGPEEFKHGQPAGVVLSAEGIRSEVGGSGPGLFTSPVLSTEFQASALYFLWKAELPEGSEMLVEVRYRAKGGQWSEWRGLEGYHTDEYPETRAELRGYFFDPDPHVVVQGVDFFQFRVYLVAVPGRGGPLFKELLVNYADLRPLFKIFAEKRKASRK